MDGELGNQIKAFEKIAQWTQKYPKPVLTMATVFLPVMVAEKLVNGNRIIQHLNQDFSLVKEGLKVISKVILEFSRAILDVGVNGLFLATQDAQKSVLSEDEWKKFVFPVDNHLVSNIKNKAEFTVLHLHGKDLFFDTVTKNLTVSAINWHTEHNQPSISECSFEGGLFGGLNENKLLSLGSNEDEIRTHLKGILKESGGNINQLIISPGCVLPLSLSSRTLELAVAEIQKIEK